jgi:hypothetical protein
MNSLNLAGRRLNAQELSSILNLVCPRCGGPMGWPFEIFKCQGTCRKDWRPIWESSAACNNSNSRIKGLRTSARLPGSQRKPLPIEMALLG